MSKPKLLIMNEPTSGLDPIMQKKFYELIRELKSQGTTVFISCHNLKEVEDVCDRVAFIKDGKIIEVISISEIKKEMGYKVSYLNPLGQKIQETAIMDINSYLQKLSKIKVSHLLITEETVDDKFYDLYKQEEANND